MMLWNRFSGNYLGFFLLCSLLFHPLHAHTRDLYFENNSVDITGGANHVILGSTPEDKQYTGRLICTLGDMESLPETTTLNVNLFRLGSIIKQDQLTFPASSWIQGNTPDTYSILLKIVSGFPPVFRNYRFSMPIPGVANNELRTETYTLGFTLVSSATDHFPENNTYTAPSFIYTVYSGQLNVNGDIQTISSLTPGSSAMCSGDRYFSEISGSWTTSWWDERFFNDSLCADISANSDGYSSDVTVFRDVSILLPFKPTGDLWVIKGQSPTDLQLRTIHLVCTGSPPKNVTLNTSLRSSTMEPDYEIGVYSEALTPNWLLNTITNSYYYDHISTFSLPNPGPTLNDLQSGSHRFVTSLLVEADFDSTNNENDSPFTYSVYSGLLYCGDVETTFTDLSFDSSLTCVDSGVVYPRITDITGAWNDHGTYPFDSADFCASEQPNSDQYSSDLHILAGNIYLGSGTATFNDLEVDLNNLLLDADGGSFISAELTLPATVSAHPIFNNEIDSRGAAILPFNGGLQSFTHTLDTVTLTSSDYALHSDSMPFYVRGSSVNLPLNENSTLQVLDPVPVYVHESSLQALSSSDPRSSFPSNDILFQNQGSSPLNEISVNVDGMSGTLLFGGTDDFSQQTSFPQARITFADWSLGLTDGQISSGSIADVTLAMEFGRGCHRPECERNVYSRWYEVTALNTNLTSNGTFGGQFPDLGPSFNEGLSDTGENSVEWGAFLSSPGTAGTFFRNDRNMRGAFVVPGFIMPQTSNTLPLALRLGQILLGSHRFNAPDIPGEFLPLHDSSNLAATLGDGMFAGITLGPENYTSLIAGIGEIINKATAIRFYDALLIMPQVVMADREAVKYTLRPGGLTGVFNTTITSEQPLSTYIYGYDMTFDRFAFRQDRNELDSNTFIDGRVTLSEGPVAENISGQQQNFTVSFVNLGLSCDGNLGAGQINTQPEPFWPDCSGPGLHNGCQDMMYWNMPVLLTGMTFDTVSETAGSCFPPNRELFIHSWNQVDAISNPLTLSGFYSPKGVFHDQTFYAGVQVEFDSSPELEEQNGFNLRLHTAYLNEVPVNENGIAELSPWAGFTVLAGLTDVPLFDDAHLAGHFDNLDMNSPETSELFIFQDETDDDSDRDGVPDSYTAEDAVTFRELLTSNNGAAPQPLFTYSWPTSNMIDLDYFARYQRKTATSGAKFLGIKKESSNIVGVVQLSSVPDYITPDRTKFSFGISADVANLQNFQLDLANYTAGGALDDFLHTLGVPTDFTIDSILCYTPDPTPEELDPEQVCLNNLEQNMLNLTGGDLSIVMGEQLDLAMQQVDLGQLSGLPLAINQAAASLSKAHQTQNLITGLLVEPIQEVRKSMIEIVTPNFATDLSLLYSSDYQAAIAVYGKDNLINYFSNLSSPPPLPANLDNMQEQVEVIRKGLSGIIDSLETGIDEWAVGVELLTRPATGVIARLREDIADAVIALSQIQTEISNVTFSNLLISPDVGENILFAQVEKGRKSVEQVRNAIENIDLGRLADVLQTLALSSGTSLDTSLLDDAQQSINDSLNELDDAISRASDAINSSNAAITADLNQIPDQVGQLFGSDNPLQQTLAVIDTKLTSIETIIGNLPTLSELQSLREQLQSLLARINGEEVIPTEILSWSSMQTSSQSFLTRCARAISLEVIRSAGSLGEAIDADTDFELYVFTDLAADFPKFCTAPFIEMLDVQTGSSLLGMLADREISAPAPLPQPSEADIRNMITTTILNSDAVEVINRVFFQQYGLLSDRLDTISFQLTDQINGLIRQTIDSVNTALSEQLSSTVGDVGDWGTTLQSVGIDGSASISQNEFKNIHLGAEFVFDGYPDPSSYNAALDITAMQDDNGSTGCGSGLPGKYYNVVLSTHNVSADMLGTNVDIKYADLGFTINGSAVPIGIFGSCFLDGEIGFESFALVDLGLMAGIGAGQAYIGANGGGYFDEYKIPKAAFYLGKSCSTDRLGLLSRLDPDVGAMVGPEVSPLFGVYARASIDIPVWNNGCAATIGAGADVASWYFTEPSPGTVGGLIGASLYGQLGCLASLKGKMQCLAQISPSGLVFEGSGWVGAGVGDCSPGSWQSISNVRHDKWCDTADASFDAVYDDGFVLENYNFNCCD